MDNFAEIMAASIAANFVCLMFGYAIWCGSKLEKQGRPLSDLPWYLIFAGLLPSAIVIMVVIG